MAIYSAYREEEEPHRIERLKRVFNALEQKKLTSKITQLHDHKGTLYVNFSDQPWTRDIILCGEAWADESEILLNIYSKGKPICFDTGGYNPFGGPET